MRTNTLLVSLFTILANGLSGEDEISDEALAFWKKEAKPLLEQNCWKCHGAKEHIKGDLRLTTRDGVIKGGEIGPSVNFEKPESSLLLEMVSYKDGDHEMPPIGKLKEEEIAILEKWVELGLPFAPDDEIHGKKGGHEETAESANTKVNERTMAHWAYVKPKRPELPEVKDNSAKHPIDRFILAKLDASGLKPNPLASKEALLRRAYFDLIGIAPNPDQVSDFLTDDSDDAFEEVIDDLLASPQYGEKWGRHWLDLVRYAETNGYERDSDKPMAWRFRDYVIKAFNDNKPYDRFVQEQLAGDELPDKNADSITATGFHRLGIWDDEPADRKLARYDYLDDILKTTSDVFLGMTIGCARCHDHKIDPIPTKDYYSLLSFFANVSNHGKGGTNLVKVENFSGNGQFQEQYDQWKKREDGLRKQLDKIEEDFLEELALRQPDVKVTKSGKNSKLKQNILLHDARTGQVNWIYTTKKPAGHWFEIAFDDAKWETGKAGFGSKGTPGEIVRTEWRTPEIWLRTSFRLGTVPNNLSLNVHHDEDATIYLNGKLIKKLSGHVGKYEAHDVSKEAADVLQTGKNVIAVHCRQTSGGQYVDVGVATTDNYADLASLMRKFGKDYIGDGAVKNYRRIERDLTNHVAKKPSASKYDVMAVAEAGNNVIKVLHRGNPVLEGDVVQPSFPSVLRPPAAVIPESYKTARTSGRRRVLAEWITSKDNPISARVMMNRVWQHHFGRGIVRSASDYGFQGIEPTHPSLLDWLAIEFMARDWNINAMHKLIMTSRAYRRSSAPSDFAFEKDPINDLFWRFDMRRLTAEEVRDSILSACGTLNLKAGGPSITPPLPQIVLATASRPGAGWGKSSPEESNRRSVYVKVKRSMQMPILINHDMADMDTSCPIRFATTVPTQSLNMLNGKFMNDSAKVFAKRLRDEAGAVLSAQVAHAFQLAFSRKPSEKEVSAGLAMIKDIREKAGLSEEVALERFALLALNLNEFVYLD
jgi:mono/diheme cytochrome c family protein